MKQKFAALLVKYPFLKWATNRFVLVTLFFIVWLLFFDTYAFYDHQTIDNEIEKLEENRDYFKAEINSDDKNIKKLYRQEEVERYAREKYYMKRENEDIYIIDSDKEYPTEETN
ncbi:septum formation initiator family protein [Flavobacterium sp. CBA20B-1]|uniref:FtsB family cell division protein n=1 Tax=unclassified Flavobacterium TaxID=196869 RepID=UPI00222500F1|nr:MULTISPECIES: septum formation initiator family protein [unclassified Flavobacterium]WCM42953.1 septum formation initiator family protein [Flavobacterium sp. CBA20B-1]